MMDMMDDDHDHNDPFVEYPSDNDLNNRLLVISMVSFTLVLFFLFCLYLFTRCVFTRRSRHHATLAALQARDSPHNTHFLSEPSTIGLNPAVMALLPTFTVRTKHSEGEGCSDATAAECVVCLNAIEEKAKLLPNCNHFFHVGCIDTWLSSQSTCPLCRAEVKPRLEPQNREGPVCFVTADSRARDSIPALLGVNGGGETSKSNGSNSRLSSFRRILSWERSSRRIQPSTSHDHDEDGVDHDLERQ